MSARFGQLFRRHVEQRPAAPAVSDVTTSLTYAELDAAVAEQSERILAAGARPGDRVAVIGDNSVEHLATAFGVWRAGCALVTIYASSTPEELEYALGHSRPSLVIRPTVPGQSVRSTVPGSVHHSDTEPGGRADRRARPLTECLVPQRIPWERSDLSAESPGTDLRSEPGTNLALICYTSGSTSRPKAVMHSHAGLAAAATAYADVWHLGPADTTLVSLPLAWAFGLVTTSMATLSAGGHVALLARSEPSALLRALAEHRATFFAGVTTIFVKMLAALDDDPSLPVPRSLRLCISGGEPRNEQAFQRWAEATGCPVHDVYAASECFPVVTYDPLRDPQPIPGVAGRVVAGAELRIVDGEAWTRGPATMLGYWGDEQLTQSVLTDDGWYRTGDAVEIDTEGYVRVVGRLSDVIIRGGANVSPAEVEATVITHPSVAEVAVVGLADAIYGEQVVAAIVPQAGSVIDEQQLTAHCSTLASYKRPTRFVVVEQLPRNANTGKVQRRQLAAQLAGGDPAP